MIPGNRTLALTFAALLVLLIAAVAVVWLPSGAWSTALSMLIAAAKALLVVLIFMRARHHAGASRLFVFGGFLWLVILFTLTFTDYWTR